MRKISRIALFVAVLTVMLTPVVVVADDYANKGSALQSQGSVTISNDYIKVVVATEGTMNMGTTGGDPGFSGDENKPLLFGYPNPRRTSFASLRVIANGKTIDHRLGHSLLPSSGPTRDGDAVSVAYDTGDVVVTERITFLESPFSGRPDMALLRFTVRNTSTSSLQAGVRNMLDVEVGNNDSAPFFVPGVGTLDTEREFSGGSLPGYFTAFESRTFEEDSLRAMGLVSGYGMTSPDRFALATWQASRGEGAGIVETSWDYAVDASAKLGDSTVASWWGPYTLAPGEERTVQTAYGLASAGGGEAWFDAPASVTCEDPTFTATLWVSNASPDTLSGISATLTLPQGLSLAAGQSMTQSISDLSPQQARSASWVVVADTQAQAQALAYSATVTFAGGVDPVTTGGTISVPACQPAATATPTMPFTSPTETPAVGPTATPAPEVPEPGSLALLFTGLGALAGYFGWQRRQSR